MVALDANNIYWLTNPDPAKLIYDLNESPKAGGPTVTLGRTSASLNVGVIGLDATSVYFPLNDQILAVPIGGGTSRVVAAGSATTSLAVTNGKVYWVDDMAVGHSVPVSGGTPTVIPLPSADVPPAAATSMLPSVDAVYARFSGNGVLGVLGIPFDGSPLTWSEDPYLGFAVDPTSIYGILINDYGYRTANASIVAKVAPTSSAVTSIASIQNLSGGIDLDDQFVYFDTFTESTNLGQILKVSKTGGSVTVLANYDGVPQHVLVDATNVYWDDYGDRTIKTIAK
jgi:hypothetical protein